MTNTLPDMHPALPEVLGETSIPGGIRLELTVPRDLRYFPGHFPGLPILPGVVQLHWAMVLARRHLEASAQVQRVAGLKFNRILQPGERVCLVLERGPAGFAFRFETGGATCSSGRFVSAR